MLSIAKIFKFEVIGSNGADPSLAMKCLVVLGGVRWCSVMLELPQQLVAVGQRQKNASGIGKMQIKCALTKKTPLCYCSLNLFITEIQMNLIKYLFRTLPVSIALLSSAMAAANPVAKVKHPASIDTTPEPSRGTGLLVGGIITTAVTPVIGLVIYTIGALNATCDSQDKSPHCGHNEAGPAAVGVAAVGIAGGVTMIVFSSKKRNAWRLWKASHPDPSEHTSETGSVSFALVPQQRGLGGMLRYQF